jgi:pimeloyl-ACP methyl ester carboxylesterase
LLADILAKSDARVHLLGHSFGCKVVMTAACVMPPPARQIESALLLQAAVSQYAFAEKVPERGVAGGFTAALDRVKRPILATYSRYDDALTKGFHIAVRRHDDLGELQFAGDESPSRFGALGGFGPQNTKATKVQINRPGEQYDLAHAERIVGVNGSRTISGHGDISNESTWWAEYCLLMAHTTDV